jgi:hypothetical protein
MNQQQPQPEDLLLEALKTGLGKLAEAAATRTTAVLRAPEAEAVLTVLRAATGAVAERPAPQPGERV